MDLDCGTQKLSVDKLLKVNCWSPGRPLHSSVARFLLVQYTKTGENIPNNHKIYQKATKYTKWPNCHEIYQLLPLQDPPKFTQIGIFGLKIGYLATLLHSCARCRQIENK
jgi:hypothetical protein